MTLRAIADKSKGVVFEVVLRWSAFAHLNSITRPTWSFSLGQSDRSITCQDSSPICDNPHTKDLLFCASEVDSLDTSCLLYRDSRQTSLLRDSRSNSLHGDESARWDRSDADLLLGCGPQSTGKGFGGHFVQDKRFKNYLKSGTSEFGSGVSSLEFGEYFCDSRLTNSSLCTSAAPLRLAQVGTSVCLPCDVGLALSVRHMSRCLSASIVRLRTGITSHESMYD